MLGMFASSLSGSCRVQLDIAGLEPAAVFPPPAARLILNVLLLAVESLPGGGVVTLSGHRPLISWSRSLGPARAGRRDWRAA